MIKDHTIHRVPFVHLYRDLSFKDFFARYDPWRDGKVTAATYSFSHKDFDFWAKLLPNSVIYIGKREDKENALDFLKRFPWFEVRVVPGLHSKVILFEKSGVLLVGSENLYSPHSSFSEVMVETFVPEEQRQKIRDLLFGGRQGNLLLCQFGVDDIRVHANGSWKIGGSPFLPCQTEVDYWSLTSNAIFAGCGHSQFLHVPDRVYVVFEYKVNGKKHNLAFDRSYLYCGDLDESACAWLIENCTIIHQRGEGLDARFPAYHPIAKNHAPWRGTWFGPVKRPGKHVNLVADAPSIDIAQRKIRERDSLEGGDAGLTDA